MNWKRGFDRVFILLAICWLVLCLTAPGWLVTHERAEAFRAYSDYLKACDDAPKLNGGLANCIHDASELKEIELNSWMMKPVYTEIFISHWWEALLFVIMVPLIFYGCLRLFVVSALWVRRGFQASSH